MERTLRQPKDMHTCPACLADETSPTTTPATHSVTDARQDADGTWSETRPRYGCARHPVSPNVIFMTGEQISFAEYTARNKQA